MKTYLKLVRWGWANVHSFKNIFTQEFVCKLEIITKITSKEQLIFPVPYSWKLIAWFSSIQQGFKIYSRDSIIRITDIRISDYPGYQPITFFCYCRTSKKIKPRMKFQSKSNKQYFCIYILTRYSLDSRAFSAFLFLIALLINVFTSIKKRFKWNEPGNPSRVENDEIAYMLVTRYKSVYTGVDPVLLRQKPAINPRIDRKE